MYVVFVVATSCKAKTDSSISVIRSELEFWSKKQLTQSGKLLIQCFKSFLKFLNFCHPSYQIKQTIPNKIDNYMYYLFFIFTELVFDWMDRKIEVYSQVWSNFSQLVFTRELGEDQKLKILKVLKRIYPTAHLYLHKLHMCMLVKDMLAKQNHNDQWLW